jgi:hypothetical protein
VDLFGGGCAHHYPAERENQQEFTILHALARTTISDSFSIAVTSANYLKPGPDFDRDISEDPQGKIP